MNRTKEIWEKMNDSEKYGCQFGLFPVWVLGYKLTTDETVELMGKGENNINKTAKVKNV